MKRGKQDPRIVMVRKLNNLLPLEKETERKDILGGETFPT